MRINGYFGHFGAPWITVRLRRKETDKALDVPFLIDTGAYRSMAGTQVIYDLGVSIHELRKSVGTAVGFGGPAWPSSLALARSDMGSRNHFRQTAPRVGAVRLLRAEAACRDQELTSAGHSAAGFLFRRS